MVRFSASLSCVCGLVNKSLQSVSRLASKSENVCVLVGGSNVKMEWRNQKEDSGHHSIDKHHTLSMQFCCVQKMLCVNHLHLNNLSMYSEAYALTIATNNR